MASAALEFQKNENIHRYISSLEEKLKEKDTEKEKALEDYKKELREKIERFMSDFPYNEELSVREIIKEILTLIK